MIYQHPKGGIVASAPQAGDLQRILGHIPWWLTYLLGIIGVVNALIAITLTDTEDNTIWAIFLGVIALAWIVLAAAWERMAKGSIEGYSRMVSEYGHFIDYVHESNSIIKDSLEALAPHDVDRTVELAHRLNTLTAKTAYDAHWRDEMEV